MIKSGLNITGELKALLEEKNLKKIKSRISSIIKEFGDIRKKNSTIEFSFNGSTIKIHSLYLTEEINQIHEAQTIERTKYYIKRLIKSLSEIKTGKHNDLNLNRWKEYNDILTDSIWLLDKRDKSGAHNGSYWGNFVPQIPNQFLRRYTKKGDWILDTFLGSGTTLIECKRLGRNGIGVELLPKVAKIAEKNITKEENPLKVKTEIINSDSTKLDYKKELKKFGVSSVQFIMMHPPYWDIIKFSENKKDLSNSKNISEFLKKFGEIIDKTYSLLDKNRYLAVVIGDKYSAGEWIPLGFYTMQEVLKRDFKLKSTIVKNFEETKGKMNQKELWRYRALVGGFYIFKHEYIFLFQKV
ncbi:MAG TPA: DNA methyltransferase [Ignavibacteriaceae bacterium]|nr:DNA methyltransferase [Ignavibacteriaceae bacterium]